MSDSVETPSPLSDDSFAGGGEMGALFRAHRWSQTPLGPVNTWPQGLLTVVGMMLNSRYPMFVAWGDQLAFLYNDGYRPILGDKHPDALGQPFADVWAEIWPDIQPLVDRALAGEPTWSENLPLFMERSGYTEEAYFTFSYSPLRDETGQVAGMFCACAENTQRLIGERQLALLRELAAKLSHTHTRQEACQKSAEALQGNPYDLPFALISLSDTSTKTPGLDVVASVGMDAEAGERVSAATVERAAHALDTQEIVLLPDLQSHWERVPVAGVWTEPAKSAALVPFNVGGHHRYQGVLLVGLNPFRLFDDGYRNFLKLVASQIGAGVASAQAYEEERDRAEALAELDRAKTRFFSNVSHEFRTPLTLMLGPLEDLLSLPPDRLSAPERQEVSVAHRNALRLLRLVTTLLDFSRVEAGRIRAAYEPVDLASLTAELASVFRSAIERAGLELVVQTATLEEPVFVDRDMWEKILFNLMSNALKFTFEGSITVDLQPDPGQPGHVLLTVSDTGVGIPEDELPRVFERFHRVKETHSRTHEGAGIGLALVQELVKQHGGRMNAESTWGEGTRFFVRIPLGSHHLPADRLVAPRTEETFTSHGEAYVAEALRWLPQDEENDSSDLWAESPADGSAPGDAAEPAARILWADDNADMRDYVARLLRARYHVDAVANGRAALEAARACPPDLVLSDIMMPELDGAGLVRALRTDSQLNDIPIILLSARAGEDERIEGAQVGADDYLVKPFSARELLARVEMHLKMVRLRRESEAAVRHSAETLERIVDHAPVAIAVLKGSDLEYVSANPAYFSIQGPDVPLIGRTFRQVFPEATARGAEAAVRAVLVTGETWKVRDYPTEVPGRDGITWWDGEVLALPNDHGEPDSVLILTWEVTQRHLAEQDLRDSERRFREFADSAPATLWTTDPQGSCTFLSLGWYEFTGQTEEEALGLGWLDAVHPEDRQAAKETFQKANAQRQPFSIDYRLRCVDGTYRWTIDAARPRFAKDGEFLGYIGSVIDVHERKEAEESLRKSEERLRLALAAGKFGSWQFELDTRAVTVTEQCRAIFGRSAREPFTYEIAMAIIPEDDRPLVTEAIQRSVDTLGDYEAEHRVMWRDGSVHWVYARGRCLPDAHGKAARLVGVVLDVTDRKEAEQRERLLTERSLAATAKFEAVFNQSGMFAAIMDLDGTVLELNELAIGAGGYPREEMVGRPFWDTPWWRGSQEVQHRLREATRRACAGEVVHDELRYWLADGTERMVAFSMQPIRDASGNVLFLNPTGIDITERKAVERERLRLVSIVENSSDFVGISNASGSLLFLNQAGRHMVGLEETHEISETQMLDFFPAEDRSFFTETILPTVREAGRWTGEATFRHWKTGRPIAVWHELFRVNDPVSGEPVNLATITRDITERKRAEEALRDSEERFRDLADNMSQFAWMADERGSIFWYNRRWLDYTGATLEDMKGRGWTKVHHPDHVDRVTRSLQRAWDTGEPWEDTFPLLGKDGRFRWFLSRAIPIRDGGGRVLRWFGTNTDVTERKQAEAELFELKESLEAQVNLRTSELHRQTVRLRDLANELTRAEQRERKRLAALLHDDLQQSLVACKMALAIARGVVESDTACNELDRAARMLDEAVASSRDLTRELRPPALYEESLGAALQWLAANSKRLYRLNVRVRDQNSGRDLDDDAKALLYECVRELLLNAAKHAEAENVAVDLRELRGTLILSVQDDGKGFDLQSTPASQENSEGFGLFSIRERLVALGGTMKLRSQPGEGARVELRLPTSTELVPGVSELDTPTITTTTATSTTSTRLDLPVPHSHDPSDCHRIVIADDHPIVREGIANTLIRHPLLSVMAQVGDGLEALDAIEKQPVDIVLLDVNMPRMNGIEAAREIRSRWPDIAIIGLSVQDDETTARSILQAGASDFVSKSTDAAQILAAVLRLCTPDDHAASHQDPESHL